MAEAIAGIGKIFIGHIMPDGEVVGVAKLGGFGAGDGEEGAHKGDGGAEGTLPGERSQAIGSRAANEVIEGGFSAIALGVAREDVGIVMRFG